MALLARNARGKAREDWGLGGRRVCGRRALWQRGKPPLYVRCERELGVGKWEVCELVRVALKSHRTPVSRILAISLKMLRRINPKLRLVVSFADNDQNHHGGIYQAGNWIYTGLRKAGGRDGFIIRGRFVRERSMPSLGLRNTLDSAKSADPNAQVVYGKGRHQYWYPFDENLRQRLREMRQPYPKRAGSVDSDAPANRAGEGGAIPTSAL